MGSTTSLGRGAWGLVVQVRRLPVCSASRTSIFRGGACASRCSSQTRYRSCAHRRRGPCWLLCFAFTASYRSSLSRQLVLQRTLRQQECQANVLSGSAASQSYGVVCGNWARWVLPWACHPERQPAVPQPNPLFGTWARLPTLGIAG